MHGVAKGGRQHQRVVPLDLVDLADLPQDVHPVGSRVVQPPQERRDIGGPDLGGQDGLGRRERQGHVHRDVLLHQPPAGLQAVRSHGHLHHRVGRDLGQPDPLLIDLIGLHGRGLERHGPIDLGT